VTGAADVPKSAFCAVSRMGYLHAGAGGPAVLFLHGWSAFKEIWWSALAALAPQARAFALDMPGHGSSPLGESRRMGQVAERVAAFCAARGIGPLTLVGHSMGGNIALELALARPALVERLVLVDAAVESQFMPPSARAHFEGAYGWALLRTSLAAVRPLARLGRRIPHTHGGGALRSALRRVSYWPDHDAAALHLLLRELIGNPLGTRLGAINIPTLVVSGEFDPLVPAALSQRVARSIPGAQYALIRGTGHNPMDERPRAFEQVLLAFVRGASQPTKEMAE